ncbi:PAS domain S-box protein [Halopenitus salinus]|uniref:histidine kinase n=1 Tax=Halopenitus salinus TaxID=1198295 RepID=A0ABD5UUL3_9EURY
MSDRFRAYPVEEPTDGVRILHVDDDPAFLDLTATFLRREIEGVSVVTESSVPAGLERVRSESIDCVISDYEMPELTGLEFLERVRAVDPDVPFILFTGKGSEEIASEAISAGVTDYIQKGGGSDQYAVLANRIENAVDQSRSRRALEESQRRLSRFIDQSPLGTIVYDETFTIRRVNEAAEEITGYSAAELVGGTWLPIVPEKLHRHVAEVERKLLDNRGGFQSVNEIRTRSGERRVCSWHNRVVTDDDGEVITIVSQFEDVTDRRRQRRELEETNAVLSTLFDTLPVGVLAEDADREVLAANQRVFDLLEIPGEPADAAGADCVELARAASEEFEDPDRFLDRIGDLIEKRQPVTNEELALADGRTFSRSYRPIDLPEGQGHLWVYQDVSDRKRRDLRLEALNETAQRLMGARDRREVAEVGVEAARDVLGLEANAIHLREEEVEEKEDGEEGPELAPVASTTAVRDLVGDLPTFTAGEGIAWRAYETGEAISIDDVREDPDVYAEGTEMRSEVYLPLGEYGILIAGSPEVGAFDDRDVVLGEILAGNVVTALEQVERTERLRERERELTRQNDRLEEFASVASHDLRNPLNVAKGRLHLAMEEADAAARDDLADVERALDRMEELIEDLLALAREENTETDETAVPLDDLARGCWDDVETDGATLRVETDRRIRADEGRLRQILENLFANAVEHGSTSPPSQTREDAVDHGSTGSDGVRITVGETDEEPGFFVADDGSGIPEPERDRVFEYGYSGSESGTGFGLSIVDQAAGAHGWDVRATASETGGARFEITGVEFVDEE